MESPSAHADKRLRLEIVGIPATTVRQSAYPIMTAMASIPDFRNDGHLPEGDWVCTAEEFVTRFCVGPKRAIFRRSVAEIAVWGGSRGATRLLIGGSFITSTVHPHDLDCLLLFPKAANIPERTERLSIEGVRLDVLFCSEDDPKLLSAFVHLFSRTRNERNVGTVSIKLAEDAQKLADMIGEPDEQTLEIVRRAYIGRQYVDLNGCAKAVVTIHGIKSHGEWSANVVQIASSNGWIVAPFYYGYQDIKALRDKNIQKTILGDLRDHLQQLSEVYGAAVSIIAHSFGTYLAMRYLTGFDVVPTPIDTLILTGSILDPKLDWDSFRGKVAAVFHEVAPNDKVVGWADAAAIFKDGLIGNSGAVGFSKVSPRLTEGRCEIFDHNNVIKRDVIINRWMPRLEAHVGMGRTEATDIAFEQFEREAASQRSSVLLGKSAQ
jgi:pimeloyl-ACP methyl ester carboxylesterase